MFNVCKLTQNMNKELESKDLINKLNDLKIKYWLWSVTEKTLTFILCASGKYMIVDLENKIINIDWFGTIRKYSKLNNSEILEIAKKELCLPHIGKIDWDVIENATN